MNVSEKRGQATALSPDGEQQRRVRVPPRGIPSIERQKGGVQPTDVVAIVQKHLLLLSHIGICRVYVAPRQICLNHFANLPEQGVKWG